MFQCNNNQKYLFVGIARSFSRLNLKKRRAFYITVFLKKSVSHYSYKDAWWVALSLIWAQYSLKYARSNTNRFKRAWVFLMCALFFAPVWKNLINNYLYTVHVTIWSKERVFKIWLIRFFVKTLWFSLSMKTFYFQWGDLYILKLIWQIRLQVSCSWENGLTNSTFQKKVRGQRIWYLKDC